MVPRVSRPVCPPVQTDLVARQKRKIPVVELTLMSAKKRSTYAGVSRSNDPYPGSSEAPRRVGRIVLVDRLP
jgi:hypothetical protein